MFAGVQWLLNGMEVENLDHSNVLTVFFSTIGSGVLLIVNVSLSFNMTMVQCIALLNSGAMVPSTIAKILLVQSGGKSAREILLVVQNGKYSFYNIYLSTFTWIPEVCSLTS
jgi:hypothetical protein